jgi:GT2 family glycosyltransferase
VTPPRIAYVLPTRDRPDTLARTIAGLSRLPRHDAQVIVVDNASRTPPKLPIELANGLPVTLLMRDTNEGAAARNAGALAADPSCEWIVMLDDDSHPVDVGGAGLLDALRDAPSDVGAVQAEIFLRDVKEQEGIKASRHEAGGLPEVFIGCGVAIRREAFLATGGYDPSFNYYVEEYDLAAKLMLAGMRITFDRRFGVVHEKTQAGRDMDVILRRLVRNNAWVMRRYSPRNERAREVRRTIARYGRIAIKERAELGYARGLLDLAGTYFSQPRREMPREVWDRFTGKAAAREALAAAHAAKPFASAAIVDAGKNEHIVREVLREMGVRIIAREEDADALVIGTLSPGPVLDALAQRTDTHAEMHSRARVIAPLELGGRAERQVVVECGLQAAA